MGGGESHLNVSLIVKHKLARTVPTNHNFFSSFFFEEKGEPKQNPVLLLTSLTPYR